MDEKELGKTGVKIPEIGLMTWEYRGDIEPLRLGVELEPLFLIRLRSLVSKKS